MQTIGAGPSEARGADAGPAAGGRGGRLVLPVLVVLAVVSTAVGSLGAPLLPTVAAHEHISLPASQWTLTISLLTGAIAAPVLGRLGDGGDRRRVIVGALAVVALGCVLSALPLSYGWLLAGRAMQGLGLGLVPLAIAAARDALPAEDRTRGIALLGVTSAAGLGVGYPVAGLLAEVGGLPAAFGAGALVTLVALVGVALVLPEGPPRPRRRLDVRGAVLLGAGLTPLLLALSQGPGWGWGSPRVVGLALLAVALLATWAVVEIRSAAPLVELRQLRHPSVLAADAMTLLVGVGIYPLLSLAVRYAQTPESAGYGYGYSAVAAGLMLVPYSAASFAAGRLSTRLRERFSLTGIVSGFTGVLILAMLVFLVARSSVAGLAVAMALAGLGVGAIFAVHPAQLGQGVPAEETGSANSFYQVLRYVGYSTGSALSATFLASSIPAAGGPPAESGYAAAAWFGIAALVVAAAAATALSRGSRRATVGADALRRPA
jgi:predicted MFS family arabinose efflux permease